MGTALVWIPVAAGLALQGRIGAALTLSLVGIFLIGTIDDVLRPVLARWRHLQLPTFVVLVSMLGGFALVGGWGLLLGLLVLRLAKEALGILKESRTGSEEEASAPPRRPPATRTA